MDKKDLSDAIASITAKAYTELLDKGYMLALTRWCQTQRKHPMVASVNMMHTAGVYLGGTKMPEGTKELLVELMIETFRHAVTEADNNITDKV